MKSSWPTSTTGAPRPDTACARPLLPDFFSIIPTSPGRQRPGFLFFQALSLSQNGASGKPGGVPWPIGGEPAPCARPPGLPWAPACRITDWQGGGGQIGLGGDGGGTI